MATMISCERQDVVLTYTMDIVVFEIPKELQS